jgi:hypothetical protein
MAADEVVMPERTILLQVIRLYVFPIRFFQVPNMFFDMIRIGE